MLVVCIVQSHASCVYSIQFNSHVSQSRHLTEWTSENYAHGTNSMTSFRETGKDAAPSFRFYTHARAHSRMRGRDFRRNSIVSSCIQDGGINPAEGSIRTPVGKCYRQIKRVCDVFHSCDCRSTCRQIGHVQCGE